MFYLIYVSTALKPFDSSELLELLTQAKENNSKLGVTGMLLYKYREFLQILEGDESVVRSLYEKIAKDPRHEGCVVVDEGNHPEREFDNWAMGFRNLMDEDVQAIENYSHFMSVPFTSNEFKTAPSLSWELLYTFKGNRPENFDEKWMLKQKFTDEMLSLIIDASAIYMCACPAQVAREIINMRQLYRYQLNCINTGSLNNGVHELIAKGVIENHARMEEVLDQILTIEKWDRKTLVMPENLRQLRDKSL